MLNLINGVPGLPNFWLTINKYDNLKILYSVRIISYCTIYTRKYYSILNVYIILYFCTYLCAIICDFIKMEKYYRKFTELWEKYFKSFFYWKYVCIEFNYTIKFSLLVKQNDFLNRWENALSMHLTCECHNINASFVRLNDVT